MCYKFRDLDNTVGFRRLLTYSDYLFLEVQRTEGLVGVR
jgi:hypothetical protein